MFQRSRRLIGAVNLDCYRSVVALRSGKLSKLWATLSTSPVSRDAKSANTAVYRTLFGILGTSSALFYWSKKNILPSINLPVIEAASENDVPMSKTVNIQIEAVKEALPAVVHIESQQDVQTPYDRKPKRIPISNGSGFIVDEKGLILTNAHVIANASYISVRLHSGKTLSATVIDVDLVADLALIRLEARYKQKFPALKFGKCSMLPGELVITLGSPLFHHDTVTSGIVSMVSCTSKKMGLNREADMEYIQTDVPIAVGNSGGPLVNLNGKVVGINTMTPFLGISFAVPSQVAEEFISSAQRITPKEKPKRYGIGVSMISINPILDSIQHRIHSIPMGVQNGVFLARVWPDSPANDAGLQVNDIIIKIDRTPITSARQVNDMVQKNKPLNVEVIRGQQKLRINITPEPII